MTYHEPSPQPHQPAAPAWPTPAQPAQPTRQGPAPQRPVHQGPLHQGPLHQGPIDQGPVHQGPIDQGPARQRPARQGGARRRPILGPSDAPPHGGRRTERQQRRQEVTRQRALEREARWANNRLAVPYRTDGPKITFGVLWFLLLVGGMLLGSYYEEPAIAAVAVAAVAAPVAGLAGLQTGNAWFPRLTATRAWTAAAAYLAGIAGFYGAWGVVVGLVIGVVVLVFYVLLYRGHRRSAAQLFDVLARSALPAGVAVASLAALGSVGPGAQASLILLVSAYEAGDFIVGSGSSNPFEGPLAGLVALGAVTFLLFLILPAPFDETSILAFAALAALCCPLGQILASGLLPRGNAWAPALRRLDSYLLAAPLWLVLLLQL